MREFKEMRLTKIIVALAVSLISCIATMRQSRKTTGRLRYRLAALGRHGLGREFDHRQWESRSRHV